MTARTVDAHLHLWTPSRGDYAWLAQAPLALQREFTIAEATETLDACGMQTAVLVQAAPTIAETKFLLDIAKHWERAAGVVGWLPLDGAVETSRALDALDDALLVGVRPMLQDLSDARYLLREEVVASLECIANRERSRAFDALILPKHMSVLLEFLEIAARFKSPLRIVLDHVAKPAVREGRTWTDFNAWRTQLRAIAVHPNACCKLSGLVTEASETSTVADVQPYIEAALECFGAARLLWGSDWPVVTLRSSASAWQSVALECMQSLTPTERDAIFGLNAVREYQLSPRSPMETSGNLTRNVVRTHRTP